MLGNYSKLIGAVLGNIVAIGLVYLGTKGVAECVPGPTPDLDQICTLFGFTTAQITGAALAVVNTAFVYFFPANKPTS